MRGSGTIWTNKTMQILLLLCMPLFVVAQQPHPILKSFEAYKQPNGILLRWVIFGGNQCQGTKVYRSEDGLDFDQINHIPGICGNFTEDETYNYFDTIPHKNTYNHYRLEMGFQGFTDIVTIFFEDFDGQNYALLSDPQLNRYQIFFTNDLGNTAKMEVFDRMGNAVTTLSNNRSDHILYTDGWRRGLYIFRITGVDAGTIFGKIFIGP